MAAFQYTGHRTMYYLKYLDLEAGHTLVADPGGSYEIMATESDVPVPPGDGRWGLVMPKIPALPPLPSLPELTEPVKESVKIAEPESGEEPTEEAPVAASDTPTKAGE